eukprot:TRINITY_DN210_c0_g1_i3.p1 TRINITY_DN210_c0_g1~~TRINITY_DN210_c0_g1_i3.p1  ORF type:complete len:230 (+),score=31.35 TRINITY_DN210_c0_g1_i3:69-692(+)
MLGKHSKTLTAGETFGEVGMFLSPHLWPATYKCVTKCRLWYIKRQQIFAILGNYPHHLDVFMNLALEQSDRILKNSLGNDIYYSQIDLTRNQTNSSYEMTKLTSQSSSMAHSQSHLMNHVKMSTMLEQNTSDEEDDHPFIESPTAVSGKNSTPKYSFLKTRSLSGVGRSSPQEMNFDREQHLLREIKAVKKKLNDLFERLDGVEMKR